MFDSDTETINEYGIIDITQDKWESKFIKFKEELNIFFEELNNITQFPYEEVFKKKDIFIVKNILPFYHSVLSSGTMTNEYAKENR